jgi:hypothetical protein
MGSIVQAVKSVPMPMTSSESTPPSCSTAGMVTRSTSM